MTDARSGTIFGSEVLPMSKARSALLVSLVLVPLALVAGTMKQTVAQIPVPTDTNPLSVSTLAYKAWFTAQIASVRLESIPAPGADPVELSWVFTGSNTDAQMHRVS